MECMVSNAMKESKRIFKLEKNDTVVLTGGLINGQIGNTNVIKVERV